MYMLCWFMSIAINANDKDDCLNPVVAHQHGDDEEDDTKGNGDGSDEVDKLADLERRDVCTKLNNFSSPPC